MGEVGDKLYIIKEGIVTCKIGVKEIRKLCNNEYFWENTLLIEQKRGADVITLQKCICYELSKEDLKEDLSDDFIDVILFCFFTYCVNNNNYMKKIIIDSLIHSIFWVFFLNSKILNDVKRDDKILKNSDLTPEPSNPSMITRKKRKEKHKPSFSNVNILKHNIHFLNNNCNKSCTNLPKVKKDKSNVSKLSKNDELDLLCCGMKDEDKRIYDLNPDISKDLINKKRKK